MSIGQMMMLKANVKKHVVAAGWGGTTSGLVFNLLSAPASGTTWADASGNGYNATLQGSSSYASNNGGGVKLNNANSTGTDYISVPYNISSTTTTIEIIAIRANFSGEISPKSDLISGTLST